MGDEKLQIHGWRVFGPNYTTEFGWAWAAQSPDGMWIGATHMDSERDCMRSIAGYTDY